MNTFSTWLAAAMFLIFGTMVVIAFGYPPGARFMPLIVGIPGLLLCAFQLVLDYLKASRASTLDAFRPAPKAGKPDEPAGEDEPEFGPHTLRREALLWAYFVGFVGVILLFGFYVAVPLMITLFLWLYAGARFRVAATYGAVATLALFLMFGELLQIRLHPGFVTPHIARAIGS